MSSGRFRSTAEKEQIYRSQKYIVAKIKAKTFVFTLYFAHLFVSLATAEDTFVLSPLRSESVSFVAERGKTQINLVFRSLIRNFAEK